MSTNIGAAEERKNKGAAWAWLKGELVRRLGAEDAGVVLSQYYDLLHQEYKDRRRVKAVSELEELTVKLDGAKSAGVLVEVRKLEKMIEARRRLLEASG